ncbi:hypothetical protein ACOMHN_024216 [Nucella lapillus]
MGSLEPMTTPFLGHAPNSTHSSAQNDDDTEDISASAVLLNTIAGLLWSVIPPVLLIFGTFGNVMIVVVMRGLRASQSTACLSVYFTALAVSDQCLLMTATLWFWVDEVFSWPPSFYIYDLLCVVPKFVWYTCSVTSAWFLVAMTFQRVTSVVAPHRVGVLCTVGRAKIAIGRQKDCVADEEAVFSTGTKKKQAVAVAISSSMLAYISLARDAVRAHPCVKVTKDDEVFGVFREM